jgi:hypothetical protein
MRDACNDLSFSFTITVGRVWWVPASVSDLCAAEVRLSPWYRPSGCETLAAGELCRWKFWGMEGTVCSERAPVTPTHRLGLDGGVASGVPRSITLARRAS